MSNEFQQLLDYIEFQKKNFFAMLWSLINFWLFYLSHQSNHKIYIFYNTLTSAVPRKEEKKVFYIFWYVPTVKWLKASETEHKGRWCCSTIWMNKKFKQIKKNSLIFIVNTWNYFKLNGLRAFHESNPISPYSNSFLQFQEEQHILNIWKVN